MKSRKENIQVKAFFFPVLLVVLLKGICHAIWYIFKKLKGVFASIESKK